MRKTFVVVLLLSTPIFAQERKLVTVSSFKHTYGQFWPESSNPCEQFTLKVRKTEEVNKPTLLFLSYEIRNCDGTMYAYSGFNQINSSGFITNVRNSIFTLTLSNPIRASITWKFPSNWKNIDEVYSTQERDQKIIGYKNRNEVIGAVVSGSIGDKLIPNTLGASVTLSSNDTLESR